MEQGTQTIYFGGGCFWCTEAVFSSLKGVTSAVPGYLGGTTPNPTYEIVSSGKSGYVEVVAVTYEETAISLSDILDVFFATHDPTTLNQQGNDLGEQYQSVIFYTSEAQVGAISEAIQRAQKALPPEKQVVTKVIRASQFYRAEDYHQRYYEQHKQQPYCQVVIHPKLEKLQKTFPGQIK